MSQAQPVPFGESIVREWISVDSTPRARVPQPPRREFPQAFIQWGNASQFKVPGFRNEAGGGTRILGEVHPLVGTYHEEARTWADVRIANPENAEQFVIVPTIQSVAFKAPARTEPDPRPQYGLNLISMQDQVTFSFSAAYNDAPVYMQNSNGEPFEPFVLNPFQSVVGVGWPQNEFFLIYFLFEGTTPTIDMELANPRGKNINTFGGLGLDADGKPINVGDPILDSDGNQVVDAYGVALYYSDDGDIQTKCVASLASGIMQEDPEKPTGALETVEHDPNLFTDYIDWGNSDGLNKDIDVKGEATMICSMPDSQSPYPNGRKWLVDRQIGTLGADGPPVVPSKTVPGSYDIFPGGAITILDAPPIQFKVTKGATNIVDGTRISTTGVVKGIPTYSGPVDGYVYEAWSPTYQIHHPNNYSYWVGFINAYLIWKMFRTTYTGAEKLSNIPEPIVVNILAMMGEKDKKDPPAGMTRAMWSWHRGTPEAFEALSGLSNSGGSGGGGEG